MTRDRRVHIRAASLDLSSFEDRFLLGHEAAHVRQQERGTSLPGKSLGRARREALEAEADRAGLASARGLPFQVTERAPVGVPLFRDAQKVLKMTLIAQRGLVVLELEDGTKESLKLFYDGNPKTGDYLFDAAGGKLEGPNAGGKPNANGELLTFWEPLDTRFNVSGKIPLKVVSSIGSDHRIQAQPELSEAMPGTKVTYYFATDPELGGRYEYKWWCENDPTEVQRRGKSPVVPGPTESKWETAWAFPGRHTVVCEVTNKNTNTKERLEFYQKVRAEQDILAETFDGAKASDYDLFRAGLELRKLDLMQGGLHDQSGVGRVPFIRCAGQNPAIPGPATDYAYNTYTIEPSPGAKKFRWYARPQIDLGWKTYFNYTKISIQGREVYDLASDGPSARWIIAESMICFIICDELDGSGQPLSTRAVYRQVIESKAAADERAKWQAYMRRSDQAINKIADKKDVGLRAAYVNRETGHTMALQLHVGPSASNSSKVMLLDLLPGVDKVEYSGNSIDAALADFDTNNSYPKGTIKLEVPSNASGIPERSRTLDTKGESTWALWSGRVGWTSMGLTAAGVISALIPGGQPVAAVLFIAAGATGAAAGSLSLYDRLQKAEKSPIGIALDVASIAASLIGAGGAVRALRAGSQALALAGTTGKFLLYSGFVTNAVSGLLISVEGVDQILAILDSPMSRGEKIGAFVRVLGMLVVQGVLFALSVREVRQMRGRLVGFLGEELTKQLPTDVLHSLNLLDDKALKALSTMTSEGLTSIAKLARENPKLANRLALMPGLALGEHEIGVAGGVLAVDGQIKMHPAKLAAMGDEEVKNLVQASKALKAAGGDLSRLSAAERKLVDDLSKSAGQRLRFDAQLKEVDTFLASVGAAADSRGQKLFATMSDGERIRVYDLVNNKRPGTGMLDKQASDFALGRARSVAEYVELFESYVAKYKEVVVQRTEAHQAAVADEVRRRLVATPSMSAAERAKLPKVVEKELSKGAFSESIDGFGPVFKKAMAAKVEKELGVVGSPTMAGSGATQTLATLEANTQALSGRIGSSQIPSGLSNAEAISRVKGLPAVNFATETSASYHVEKHLGELPPSERSGSKVADFLASAKKTIQTGAPDVKINQDGSRNLSFVREVTEGETTYKLTAMVKVTDEGKILLATYGGSKK